MAAFALGLLAGALGWTLLEYIVHAGLGHGLKGKLMVSREHLHHHADINYFSPLRAKLQGAVPVLSILLLATHQLGGWAFASGFVLAISGAWAFYEWLHEAIHVSGPRGPYSRWAARHHLHHHFSKPGRNHGVTTPLWDWLLRTYEGSPQVRVPAKRVADLPWLAATVQAKQNGGPLPPYADDYVVAGRGLDGHGGQQVPAA